VLTIQPRYDTKCSDPIRIQFHAMNIRLIKYSILQHYTMMIYYLAGQKDSQVQFLSSYEVNIYIYRIVTYSDFPRDLKTPAKLMYKIQAGISKNCLQGVRIRSL
jgi:hypothetical protein